MRLSIRNGAVSALALSFALASAAELHAQTAPPVSPGLAAQIGAPTREEVTRPAGPQGPRAPSKLTVEGGIQRAPCALADDRFAGVTVTLNTVYFDHLRAVSPDDLRPAYADYLGKTVPIATVCEIRDAAATILRGQGYLAAVQVPPQRIENGVIHFDVLMPKLVAVHVRGDAGKSAPLIQAYLQKLVGQPVFNQHDAERYLLFTRDLPGYDVRLTLRPAASGVPGEVEGDVAVLRQPYAIDFNLQDYGAKSVGRVGGLLRGELYDVLGLGDRLSLGVFSTADFKEQQVVQAGYDFHVGGEGLGVTTGVTYAWTHPSVANLDIRSRTLVGNLGLRYPLIRSQSANLVAAGGFDFVDQDVRFNGVPLTREHLRTGYVRLSADATDPASIRAERGYTPAEPRWRIGASVELRQGLDIFGATNRCTPNVAACAAADGAQPTRPDVRPRASIVRGSITAEWRPVPKITFALSPQAQYAFGPTLQYEQFSAGNYTVGRGYDPGAIRGDDGVGFTAELRYGSLVPHDDDSFAFQPYVFFDGAWTGYTGYAFTGRRFADLQSVGGGVRSSWGSHARLDLNVAVPIAASGSFVRRGDTRVLFSITTRILPWRR